MPSPENTNGVDKNGTVTEFSAKGVRIYFENRKKTETIEGSKYAFDNASGAKSSSKYGKLYKDVKGEYLPYKAVENGQQDVVIAKVKFTGESVKLDSLDFKTSAGAVIPSKKNSDTEYELTVKGSFKYAEDQIMAVYKPKDEEKYVVAGAMQLIHLNAITLPLKIVPTSSTVNTAELEKLIKAQYRRVGVKVDSKVLDLYTGGSLDVSQVSKDDKKALSSYTPSEQKFIDEYFKTHNQEAAFYLFVTDQAGGLKGRMPIQNQFGFVSDDAGLVSMGLTAVHELGHGAFELQHPFTQYNTTRGDANSTMDIPPATDFNQVDWKQMNMRKFSLKTVVQTKGDGARIINDYKLEEDGYFVTPAGELLYLTKGTSLSYLCDNPNLNGFNGVVYGFTTVDGKRYVNDINIELNELNSRTGTFRGYYQVDSNNKSLAKDSRGNKILYQNNPKSLKVGKQIVHFVHAIPGEQDVLFYILKEEVSLTNDWISQRSDYSGSRYKERKYNAKGEYITIIVSTGCEDYNVFVENISIENKITLEVYKNNKTGKYQVNVVLLGQPKDKKYVNQKEAVESELRAIAEEKLNELNGLDGAKTKSSSLNVFDVEGADAGEFYVAEMNGRKWLSSIENLGTSIWETANLPEEYWNKDKGYSTSTVRVPPMFAGVSNGVTEEVLGLQQLVKLGYDVATKEEVRTGIWDGITNITFNSVIDAGDEAIRNKVNQYANHKEKPYIAQQALGKDAVQVATAAVGVGLITKSGKLAEGVADVGKQIGKIGKYDWNLVR